MRGTESQGATYTLEYAFCPSIHLPQRELPGIRPRPEDSKYEWDTILELPERGINRYMLKIMI